MADVLIPLKAPPGLYKNGTKYQSKGRWYDAHLVRFIDDTIQPVGGWRRATDDAGVNLAALVGVPRAAVAWESDSGTQYIAIGTTQKLYVLVGGVMHDITPVGFTTGRVDTGTVSATGAYSAGFYGTGAYGAGSVADTLVEADTWQLAAFGNYLAAVCTSDKKLYIWAGDPGTVAAVAAGAPASVSGVFVTPERFLMALGAGGNVRQIQWPTQETSTDWVASATNSAGDLPVSTDGRVRSGASTRGESLVWTDCDLHAITYIGRPFVYRIAQVGKGCGIVAPNARAAVDTLAFWMGHDNFYVYEGVVKKLPCEVRDYVFGDFNHVQAVKVWAMAIAEFGEIWWFYPSAGSTEIDRYVVFNYVENHWTVGKLARTCGFDAGATTYPVMITPAGLIYEHEVLQDRGDEVPYLEGGPFELGDGNQLMNLQRIIPDEKTLGDVQLTIFSSFFPTAVETTHGPYTAANPTPVRVLGRQMRLRLDQANETNWRFGVPRLGLRPGARR